MRIVIIGGVAAGTSVATKAKRNDPECEAIVLDQNPSISYAACGIPYTVGDLQVPVSELAPRDVQWFKQRGVDIRPSHQVTEVDLDKHLVKGMNLQTQEPFQLSFDELVLATGSLPKMPAPLKPMENCHTIKTPEDALWLQEQLPQWKQVAVIGAGYIGLEMTEQLTERGIQVHLIQHSELPMSTLTTSIRQLIKEYLVAHRVQLHLDSVVTDYQSKDGRIQSLTLTDGTNIAVDAVLVATGVMPNTKLAQQIGVQLGQTGAIRIDERLATNQPHVYAVGDCAETVSFVTGKTVYRPLATNANRMGRILGEVLTGGNTVLKPMLGTALTRCFELTIASVGATQKDLDQSQIPYIEVEIDTPAKSSYIDWRKMKMHAFVSPQPRQLLGVQLAGEVGVDKRIDVLATAMMGRLTVDDLFDLDLAYEPLYSTSRDAIAQLGLVAGHAIDRFNSQG